MSRCPNCKTEQALTSTGTCKHCPHVLLPGSKPATCSYKGCTEPAKYRNLPPTKAYSCHKHGKPHLGVKRNKGAQDRAWQALLKLT